MKHLDGKQQGGNEEAHRDEEDEDENMRQIRCSNGCSLEVNSAFLYRQSYSWGISLFSPATRGYWTCLAPLPLSGLTRSSPGGTEFGCEARQKKKVNKIHTSAPQTRVCVCLREGSRHHVCIPAWGRDPPPACRVRRPGPLRSVEPDE